MSRLMGKRVRIGKYAVPALLLLALTIGTVAAAVYVILQFTVIVTVEEYPAVNFWEWPGGPRTNTFTETFDIFPAVTTINDNASHGIFSEETKTCKLWISDISPLGHIQWVNMTVVDPGVQVVYNFGDSLPTSEETLSTSADTKYTIRIDVRALPNATATTDINIDFEMKVESP